MYVSSIFFSTVREGWKCREPTGGEREKEKRSEDREIERDRDREWKGEAGSAKGDTDGSVMRWKGCVAKGSKNEKTTTKKEKTNGESTQIKKTHLRSRGGDLFEPEDIYFIIRCPKRL